MRTKLHLFGIAALAGAALVACDDTDDITGPPDGEASFTILMESEGASASTTMSMVSMDGPSRAVISLDAVESIILPIGEVQAHQVGGAWVDAGTVDDDIDLLDLPAEGIVLVEGSLPEGSYDRLRFFLDGDATITLSETVVVGRTTFEAGEHTLRIPSAEQAGFRVAADFKVDGDGETLTIVVDENATVGHVTATGSGVLKIAPVLTVRNDDGDDVGEFDPDDDDEEDEEEFEGVVSAVGESSFTLEDGTVIVIDADTEFDGDLLSLEAVAEAVANPRERVEVEGEGTLQADGSILASEVEFEVEEVEAEVEGQVTSVDEGAGTFTVLDTELDAEVTVQITDETVIELDGDASTFADVVALFEAGATIEADAEGWFDADGVLQADEVDFEVEKAEVEGQVTSVDEGAGTFTVLDTDLEIEVTVLVTDETVIEVDDEAGTFADVVALFAAGASIEADAEGWLDADGVLHATEVDFEVDDGS